MKRLTAALVLLVMLVAAPVMAAPYVLSPGQTCDGWPRLPIEMAPGMCAGLVVAPPPGTSGLSKRVLRMPRTLVQLPGGDWIVTDLGGWDPAKGSVWRLRAEAGRPAVLTPLLKGLTMPHGLAIGPDGLVYVGEMSRIIRMNPGAPLPATTVEVVVAGLPDNRLHDNRHPLSNFIFDANGDLLVNVGAPSDSCLVEGKPDGTPRCLQSEGTEALAGVRRYRYLSQGRWAETYTMVARGLRNSLALARTPAGTLLQAENSYDFDPAADRPFEELNVLVEGRHYGWPYCYDMVKSTPGWVGATNFRCRSADHTRPALLLPPHAAPLGMLVYQGGLLPQLQGRLLVSYHGYRATGARIVAFALDARGMPVATARARYPAYGADGLVWKPHPGPAAEPLILTPGWQAVADKRPMGAPVGLAVAADGAVWVADDRNGTVVRVSVDRP
ncbi:PQQ-dependent sugar dehydrogenase [Caulobacter henricii]|uniref:Pyrroloquinoline quinone-dependent pyranose dehydrogenase beta-propeller domain-containing protein n=1 Tax=Caulobacter henricii TaxID=69395 RepID=A0A0P0P378_9CAUL|nr:PQQ-dependent sugar dehydrogenase [Caulobacter henricii]ALL14846.1 hypothetical protein AQ619_16560 [Caulobacter henricii]